MSVRESVVLGSVSGWPVRRARWPTVPVPVRPWWSRRPRPVPSDSGGGAVALAAGAAAPCPVRGQRAARPAWRAGLPVRGDGAVVVGQPARIRAVSLKVHSGAPRVGHRRLTCTQRVDQIAADSGVWLSKNSQLTITTGA